ncbi:phage tail protein [Pseudomonas reactans]|nr:phage tail protein [Pseudomonas reactans]
MATFKSVVTKLGQASIAAAIQSGKDINIIEMAIGDGGGKSVEPVATQTQLVKEVYRTKLNSLRLDAKNANWVIAEAIISASVGGFWMREMGLYDDDGVLIAVCNIADTYKPTLAEGSGRTQTLRMVIRVTDTSAVTLTLDDSLIVATEEYVNDLLAAHEKSRNHPDGTLTEKGFVQLSSATDSENEKQAATPQAVKMANDNANGRLPSDGTAVAASKLETARKIAGNKFDGTQDISIRASDVDALPSNGTAVAASKLATARKIAGVDFDGSSDIAIGASNVGAVQQGGGVGMRSNNVVHIGWSDGNKLLAQVDNTPFGAIYCEGNKPTSADVGALPVTGGDVEYINGARHFASKSGVWEGAGAFAAQYENGSAPFMVPFGYTAEKGFSKYHPIVKGTLQTKDYGYGAAVSFGALTSGNAEFPVAVISVTMDSRAGQTWSFNPVDGSFYSPGDINTGKNISAGGGVHAGGDITSGGNIISGSGAAMYERNASGLARVYSSNNPQPLPQDLSIAGNISSNEGGIYERGQRVYSPNYRPQPSDVNAIARDTCSYAGFAGGNPQSPYMRNSNNDEVVALARYDWVNVRIDDVIRWATANFVADVKIGPRVVFWSSIAGWSDAWDNLIPAGAVNISSQTYNDNRVNRVVYAYVMKLINGNWYNVGG